MPAASADPRGVLLAHGGDITWDEILLIAFTYLLLLLVVISGFNRRATVVGSTIARHKERNSADATTNQQPAGPGDHTGGGAPISLLDVSFRYGRTWVLRRVDLSITSGQFVSIIGANGAGKTTLLNVLSTVEAPTAGDVVVGSASLRADPAAVRSQVGVVAHKPLLYPQLTVVENLRLFTTLFGLADAVDERIEAVLDQVSLLDRRHEQVRRLSHGQKQRVAFARALLHEPGVLLLDEPFAGLDLIAADRLDGLLDQLSRAGRTIVMTSHDLRRSYERADRLVLLAGGRIVDDLDREGLTLDDLEARYRSALGAGR